ncbi:MAG: PDZ domain-containing protein [bacterium]|nr:PDZ domain-containing protein [bacterium]
MNFLYSVLSFGVVLGIIVLVHEFGHYIAARLVGVRVEVFSFGFGKRLFGKRIGDTDFRMSLIPLGGYVKMAGDEEYDPTNLKPYEFQAKNRAQKIFILSMGAVMNILLTFFIYTAINITGVEIQKYKLEPPQLGYVRPDSPADKAGFKEGDLILALNGRKVDTWLNLQILVGSSPNETVTIEYERQGKVLTANIDVTTSAGEYESGYAGFFWYANLSVGVVQEDSPAQKAGILPNDIIREINGVPYYWFDVTDIIAKSANKPLAFKIKRPIPPAQAGAGDENASGLEQARFEDVTLTIVPREITTDGVKRGQVGINFDIYTPTTTTTYGLLGAMGKGIKDMENLVFLVFNSFKKMIVGKFSPKQLAGPIEIAKFSQRAMRSGATTLFSLIAFISLQLGIVNLFPIPALDGGHLLIYTIEAITRREFSMRAKMILMNTGFLILISLMVFVVLNDIAKVLPNGWGTLWPF